MSIEKDKFFMLLAMQEAQKALIENEVPIGAIVVHKDQVIARAYNKVEQEQSAIAHAELLVLKKACSHLNKKYLPDCTLYVTLEPCPMCASACYWTQLGNLFFATQDPKRGYKSIAPSLLHPKTIVSEGLFATESSQLLKTFFQNLRLKKATKNQLDPFLN